MQQGSAFASVHTLKGVRLANFRDPTHWGGIPVVQSHWVVEIGYDERNGRCMRVWVSAKSVSDHTFYQSSFDMS